MHASCFNDIQCKPVPKNFNIKKLTLPERQENDGLDGEKLDYWIIGAQQIPSSKVE